MRLLTRNELALHRYTDPTRPRLALGSLAVAADRTQATNGHLAVTVFACRPDPADYPSPADGALTTLTDGAPTLLPAEQAKAALAAIKATAKDTKHLPILQMAAVGVGQEGETQIAATNLDSWHRAKSAPPATGIHAPQFPRLDKVRPNGKVIADVGFMVENFGDALTALKDLGVRAFRLQLHRNLDGPAEMIGCSTVEGLSRVEVIIMPATVNEPPARPGEVAPAKSDTAAA